MPNIPNLPSLPSLRRRDAARAASMHEALEYIDNYWPKLLRESPADEGSLIGLPHPYLVPSNDSHSSYGFHEQYYWDTYFMSLALTDKKYEDLVTGMLENLIALFKRFDTIPNASRMYFLSRSQPPILTKLIFQIYDTFGKDQQWLVKHTTVAQAEYQKVWMSTKHPQWHQVYRGLSRYYDINVLHDLAEAESGWDMTPRFGRKCLDYLPIDLNSLLYQYETDFARVATIVGNEADQQAWIAKAAARKSAINELMWGKLRGFYFDYNYQKEELGSVWSLAGYYPMWVGLASPAQTERMVNNLTKFERKGGLTTTTRPIIDMSMFGSLKTQWAYPNGWAPLHLIVFQGLKRYGYHAEAERIAGKWLATNLSWFAKHGEFIEKYNVVSPTRRPLEGVYPSQSGFGWTNGVFVYLAKQQLGLHNDTSA